MGYIYRIKNKINNKMYVGQTKNSVARRWTEHKRDAKNPKYAGFYIHRAIKKYGVENFEVDILEEAPCDLLNEREVYWINYYDTFKHGYNLTSGGGQNIEVSDATKEKHRYNVIHGITGHAHLPRELVYTKEVREKMSKANKGRKLTDEQRRKLSESLKGKTPSAETREKLRQSNLGNKLTQEAKDKISKKQKERLKDKTNHNFYQKYGRESSRHIEIDQFDKNHKYIQTFGSKLEALASLNLKGHNLFNLAIRNKTLFKEYYWSEKAVETIEIIRKE
mgnify:CR=1 FL=1